MSTRNDRYGMTALMEASRSWPTNPEGAKLLLRNGADVNAKQRDGMTALMWACMEKRLDIVKLLLRNGADLNTAKDRDGKTALMWAKQSWKGGVEVERLLKAYGAKE